MLHERAEGVPDLPHSDPYSHWPPGREGLLTSSQCKRVGACGYGIKGRNKGVVVAVWGEPYLQRGRSFRRQETSKRQRPFRKMYSSTAQCYVKFTVSPQACRKCADNICVQSQLKVQVIWYSLTIWARQGVQWGSLPKLHTKGGLQRWGLWHPLVSKHWCINQSTGLQTILGQNDTPSTAGWFAGHVWKNRSNATADLNYCVIFVVYRLQNLQKWPRVGGT
jgi:hypothetical protein